MDRDKLKSVWDNIHVSAAYLRMYMIIIISVFQKCKGTEFLAREDGTQMFCSDDLYFFVLGFFFHHQQTTY